MVYLITYDLNAKGQDYNDLYDKIKSLGESFHPLESVWFLQSDMDANAISQQLRATMDDNDSVFIVEITQRRQGWLPKTAWEWLNSHQ